MVATQRNDRGEWVTAIPLPLYIPAGRLSLKQCHCGRLYWTMTGYRGHYALAHILGTP